MDASIPLAAAMAWTRDAALWCFCWAADQFCMRTPETWLWWKLLPGAGLYGYSASFAEFRARDEPDDEPHHPETVEQRARKVQ